MSDERPTLADWEREIERPLDILEKKLAELERQIREYARKQGTK